MTILIDTIKTIVPAQLALKEINHLEHNGWQIIRLTRTNEKIQMICIEAMYKGYSRTYFKIE